MTKNIVQAIQNEAEYYHRKFDLLDDSVKIYDFIGPCGYDDVNEFYWDKQLYLFGQQDFVVVEEPYIDVALAMDYMMNKQPAFLYTIDCDNDYIFMPSNYVITENIDILLKKHNLTRVDIGYDAENGLIVSSNGDLRVYLIYDAEIELPQDYILNFLRDELAQYFDNVTVDNNDILINNQKVIGSVSMRYGDVKIFVCQCTYIDKTEAIQEICGVNAKVPGVIDSSILSAEKLKDDFIEWLQQ